MNLKVKILGMTGILALVAVVGCGSDPAGCVTASSLTAVSNSLGSAAPSIAVTSPTLESSCGASLQARSLKLGTQMLAWVGNIGPLFSLTELFGPKKVHAGKKLFGDGADELKPINEMVNDLTDIINGSVTEAAANFQIDPKPERTACYGPKLTWNGTPLPSGDLALFGEAEADGTACSAAQLNYLTASMGFSNSIVKAIGIMLAAAEEAGQSLPSVGNSITVTPYMPVLGASGTVSNATLARMSNDASGNAVYKTSITIEVSTGNVTITNYHTPTSSDNSTFKGFLKAVMPYSPASSPGAKYRAFSLVYNNDGTYLTVLFESAGNRSSANTDFFAESGSGGRVDYSKPAFGEEAHRILARFNPETNEGVMKYAWQAGSGDGATRTFEVDVTKSGEIQSGFAYVGYGVAIGSLSVSAANWTTKFYPNWTSGLSGGSALTNEYQGQKFAQATAGGIFKSTEFHGPFVPTSSGVGSGTITANASFDGTRTVSTLDFVTSPELGTLTTITVPTYTLPE